MLKKLNETQPLQPILFDNLANKAVRANSKSATSKKEAKSYKGGSIASYDQLKSIENSNICAEFTMPKFEGSTGQDFVAL